MKAYGANKATEFTKKQINVIYANNKQGNIVVSDSTMKEFYNLADYYGFDDNRSIEREEASILAILNAVFAKDYTKAQELINNYR